MTSNNELLYAIKFHAVEIRFGELGAPYTITKSDGTERYGFLKYNYDLRKFTYYELMMTLSDPFFNPNAMVFENEFQQYVKELKAVSKKANASLQRLYKSFKIKDLRCHKRDGVAYFKFQFKRQWLECKLTERGRMEVLGRYQYDDSNFIRYQDIADTGILKEIFGKD